MSKFRPCIDLHSGQVKQIVGGTLSAVASDLKTNYVSKLPASHYANLYRQHDLHGGHVVMLGSGNTEAAQEALRAWPGGLQVAGGITDENASYWIEQGAEKVSYIYIHIFKDHTVITRQLFSTAFFPAKSDRNRS
jgi:phosphoribosylformimino-5-aminoimidazole carboxamide ribotide isomerase